MQPYCWYSRMGIALVLCLASILHADAASLYSAYFRPDAIDLAGSVHAYVLNTGDKPLRVLSVAVDGKDVGPVFETGANFLRPEFREKFIAVHNDDVLWYRVYPNPVPPGGIGEIIVRKTAQPEGRVAELAVRLGDGSTLSAALPSRGPDVWLEYVAFSSDMRDVWIYARRRTGLHGRAAEIELDGRNLRAEVFGPWHGIFFARARLKKPLRYCSDHVIAVRTDGGFRHASMLRAIPMPLPIGIMGTNSDSDLKEYASHLFDTNIAFGPVRKDGYERLERYGLTGAYIYYRRSKPHEKKYEPVFYTQTEVLEPIKSQPALWAYFLEDEPDGRYHRSELTIQGIARDVERAHTFCRIFDPDHPTYLQMDHGSFPKNLFRWGQIPDLLCCHAYPFGGQIVRQARLHTEMLREASRPKPFFYLCEGYSANDKREFGPLEMRLEVLSALAEGAKGLQWYPAHHERGLLKHPRMWHAVGRMNTVLHMAMPYISMGTPVPGARCSHPDVHAQTILCGDRALAVIVRNDRFVSTPDRFELTPAEDVTVRVRSPRYIHCALVVRLTAEGPQKVPFKRSGSLVTFTLPDVDAGEVLLALRDKAQLRAIQRLYDAELKAKVEALPSQAGTT